MRGSSARPQRHASSSQSRRGTGDAPVNPELVEQLRENRTLRKRLEDKDGRMAKLQQQLAEREREILQLQCRLRIAQNDVERARDEAKSAQDQMQRDRERSNQTMEELQKLVQAKTHGTLGHTETSALPLSSTGSTPDTTEKVDGVDGQPRNVAVNSAGDVQESHGSSSCDKHTDVSALVQPHTAKVKDQLKAREILSKHLGQHFDSLGAGISFLTKSVGAEEEDWWPVIAPRLEEIAGQEFQTKALLVEFLKKINTDANEAKHPLVQDPPSKNPHAVGFLAIADKQPSGSTGPARPRDTQNGRSWPTRYGVRQLITKNRPLARSLCVFVWGLTPRMSAHALRTHIEQEFGIDLPCAPWKEVHIPYGTVGCWTEADAVSIIETVFPNHSTWLKG